MKNTLKFSLLSTLLCTMSLCYNNGYSLGEEEEENMPLPYIQDIKSNNRLELKKKINTFNINTNPSDIADFAKQLRTRESRIKYSRQAAPASVDFAMIEYPSLNLILNHTINSETIEDLATKLLQDHLSFISEFSSKNGLKDEVVKLFYDAWIRIFVLAEYSSNNQNLPELLRELGDHCFEHFNIPYFYKK